MVTYRVDDPKIWENKERIDEIRKSGLFSEDELQQLYIKEFMRQRREEERRKEIKDISQSKKYSWNEQKGICKEIINKDLELEYIRIWEVPEELAALKVYTKDKIKEIFGEIIKDKEREETKILRDYGAYTEDEIRIMVQSHKSSYIRAAGLYTEDELVEIEAEKE